MKSLDQFTPLTENEILTVNGGGALDSLIGLVNSIGNQALNNGLTNSIGAGVLLVGAGISSALSSIGAGLGIFFSKLGLPTV